MVILRKSWLLSVLVLVLGIILIGAAGCGGGGSPDESPNGDQNGDATGEETSDPGETGVKEGDYFDFDSLYPSNKEFKDGESFKLDLWQQVGGEESSGWISMEVTEAGGEFTFDFAWELDGEEYSGTFTMPGGPGLYNAVADQLAQESSWDISDLWQYCWVPVIENYEGLDFEKVGDKAEVIGYTMEVTGRKTYAGQEGINFTMHEEDKLLHELCISPDIAVNLYQYYYDYDGNEYRVELVEYSR